MVTEFQISNQGRLHAIEQLLAITMGTAFANTKGMELEHVDMLIRSFLNKADLESAKDLDPTLSDALAASYQEHLARLLADVRENFVMAKKVV